MPTLTQLTDLELDTVTGGSFNILAFQNAIAANSVATGQGQVNVAALTPLALQGGSQTSNNNQGAVATNS